MELTFRRPDDVAKLSVDDWALLVQGNNDLCIIGGKRFFIRALLSLPMRFQRPTVRLVWMQNFV